MKSNTKGIGPGRLALPDGEGKAVLPTAWRKYAACNDGRPKEALRVFFEGEPQQALKTCAVCTVRPTCLAFALLNDERYGVWGGMDQDERAKLHEMPRGTILKAVFGALPELFEAIRKRAR